MDVSSHQSPTAEKLPEGANAGSTSVVTRASAVALALRPPQQSTLHENQSLSPAPQLPTKTSVVHENNPLHRVALSENRPVPRNEGAKPTPSQTTIPSKTSTVPSALKLRDVPIEPLLLLSMSILGGYLGTLIRIASSYLRPVKTWELFPGSYLYPNIVGCFIMGFIAHHKGDLASAAGPMVPRVLYHFIASGFCGSLTTFSGWQSEVAKLLVLQADSSFGNIATTFNGARIADYFVQQWSGYAVSFLALEAGFHAAEAAAVWGPAVKCTRAACAALRGHSVDVYSAFIIVFITLSMTVIVAIVPPVYGWPVLTWAAFFGAAGAYARFQLSLRLNARSKTFPWGTFVANVMGTWIYAAIGSVARFSISYDDHFGMAALFGIDVGFCGCLTTMSTWVLELRGLPRGAAYTYAAASLIAAALGPVLFVELLSGLRAADATRALISPPLDFCVSYEKLCQSTLNHLQCPEPVAVVTGCGDAGLTSFVGLCICVGLNTSNHIAEALIDSQVKNNMWPTNLDEAASDPSSVLDACLTQDNMCDHLMHRIGCPAPLRHLNSCDRGGLSRYRGECACGAMSVGSRRISELLIDFATNRREDLLPFTQFAAASPWQLNLCTAYTDVCSRMLDHVQCPLTARVVTGCTNSSDYGTWVGACTCLGAYTTASSRIGETLLDSIVRPHLFELVYTPVNTSAPPHSVDGCATYEATCAFFLDTIGCPASYRGGNAACSDGAGGTSCLSGNCSITNWLAQCACVPPGAPPGTGLLFASKHVQEVVIDSVLQPDLTPFLYFPPATAPYSLVSSSNPFRPLLALQYPLPTQ